MTNIFETIKDYLQQSVDFEPTIPLNIEEAMSCGLFLTKMDEASIFIQIVLNTTPENDVIRIFKRKSSPM